MLQDFLNRHRDGQGQGWYQREAMRAVNQTLGRVIRHRALGSTFCTGWGFGCRGGSVTILKKAYWGFFMVNNHS